jgi:hypothetical protein
VSVVVSLSFCCDDHIIIAHCSIVIDGLSVLVTSMISVLDATVYCMIYESIITFIPHLSSHKII